MPAIRTRMPAVLALLTLALSGCVTLRVPAAPWVVGLPARAAQSAQAAEWGARLRIVPAASDIAPTLQANPVSTPVFSPGMKSPPHPALLDGTSFASVEVWHDRTVYDGPLLVLALDGRATQSFAAWTGEHRGQQLLFVLDGTVISAPVITQRIDTGHFGVPLGYDPAFPWQEPGAVRLP